MTVGSNNFVFTLSSFYCVFSPTKTRLLSNGLKRRGDVFNPFKGALSCRSTPQISRMIVASGYRWLGWWEWRVCEPHDSTPESMHSYSPNLHVRPRITRGCTEDKYLPMWSCIIFHIIVVYVSPFLSRFFFTWKSYNRAFKWQVGACCHRRSTCFHWTVGLSFFSWPMLNSTSLLCLLN